MKLVSSCGNIDIIPVITQIFYHVSTIIIQGRDVPRKIWFAHRWRQYKMNGSTNTARPTVGGNTNERLENMW